MSQEYSSTSLPESKKKNLMPLVSILGIVILFIADLYVIINNSNNYVVLAVITVLMLIWISILANHILKQSEIQKIKEAEKMEELFRGQKANYLQQKKVVEQIADVKNTLKVGSSTEDIITAQKALAKVTIRRSKENAEALMNSNDKVMEKMKELIKSVEDNNGEVLSQQKTMIDDYIKEIVEKEQEILSGLQEMEASIRSEVSQTVDKMNELANEAVALAVEKAVAEMKQTIAVPVTETAFAEEMPVMEEETPLEEMPVMEEETPLEETPVVEEETPLEEMPVMEEETPLEEMPMMEEETPLEEMPIIEESTPLDDIPLVEENSVLEDMPILEEDSVSEEMSVAEEEARLDSILADVQGLESEINIPSLLPEEEEEPSIEEDSLSIDNILADIPSLLPEEEEEPSIEEDSLSIDNILADIPSLGEEDTEIESGSIDLDDLPVLDDIPIVEDGEISSDESVPNMETILSEPVIEETEPVLEAEPVTEETAVQQEKPQADSNKIMTPDEIAALIANL